MLEQHRQKPVHMLALAALILTASFNATAMTDEEKGMAIAIEAKKADKGWGDMRGEMKMILRNQQGQESVREIRMKSLEVDNDGDKSLTIFDTPSDVKGTAFLSFSHSVGADDQWLYLPALKRVKRISSKNKSGPFMGSEFSYEDFASFEVEKYTYKYLRDETLNGLDCYVIEQYPVDENSGYTRRVAWGDKEHHRVQKVDFYDRKDSLLKTLVFTDYQQYIGHIWRSDKMSMINHQNGKSTELAWSGYQFQTGLDEGDFNTNSLKRVR